MKGGGPGAVRGVPDLSPPPHYRSQGGSQLFFVYLGVEHGKSCGQAGLVKVVAEPGHDALEVGQRNRRPLDAQLRYPTLCVVVSQVGGMSERGFYGRFLCRGAGHPK